MNEPLTVGRLDYLNCSLCGCPVQRTPDGDLMAGMEAHRKIVHGIGT